MKSLRNLSILVLCLVFAGAVFAASPAAETAPTPAPPAEAAASTADAPLPWTVSQVIPALAPGDCGDQRLAGGFQLPKCGACSPSPCANANLNSVCGTGGGGQIARCIDDGLVCSDNRPRCTCRTGPI